MARSYATHYAWRGKGSRKGSSLCDRLGQKRNVTRDPEGVTCKICLKLLQKGSAPAAKAKPSAPKQSVPQPAQNVPQPAPAPEPLLLILRYYWSRFVAWLRSAP